MANPNIAALSAIYGRTDGVVLTTANTTDLLVNLENSGIVYKVGSIIVANKTNANTTVTLNFVKNLSTTPVTYSIASVVGVPARASIILVGRDAPLYIDEDKKLAVVAGTAAALDVVISYEEIN